MNLLQCLHFQALGSLSSLTCSFTDGVGVIQEIEILRYPLINYVTLEKALNFSEAHL